MKPEGKVLQKDLDGAIDTEIVGIEYDLETLKIFVSSSSGSVTVKFGDIYGFRVLDEGDLCEFWPRFSSPSGWLYEISCGGWKELESTRDGFLSSHHEGMREFLVTGEDDCVSVIGFSEPQLSYEP